MAQLGGATPREGERMFIASAGNSINSRLERFPPRLEIRQDGGIYVLIDEGPVATWRYEFVGE
jgi:hypothetical protein